MTKKELLEIIEKAARDGRTELDLSDNLITSVPNELGELKNLTMLYLHNNRLTSVPESLGHLKNLTTLYLSGNQLTSVPKSLGRLENLEELYLYENRITSIPKELGKLKNLTTLYLFGNQLESVPKELGQLKKLKRLYLFGNRLTSVPKELGQLKNLEMLELSNNQLTSVPKELGQLENLKMLELNENRLTSVPAELGQLKDLKRLDLRKNKITELPAAMLELKLEIKWEWKSDVEGIFLADNPWERPPIEIVKQGSEAIRNYFESIEAKEISRVYEAKLLIVGEGGVGKTCLMKRLMEPGEAIDEKELTTEGIEINRWLIDTDITKNFRVNFWDFGGQEIYHATHQFFLTKRSLYLFVWTARTDDDMTGFDYWLNVVRLLSDNSPVIVVLNKIDERIKSIDEHSLQVKFDNIVWFDRVSARQGKGIEALTAKIRKQIGQLPHIGDELPTVWVDIRRELEGLDRNYISYDEYRAICSKFGLNKEKAEYLSRYYHDLGVFLHFLDNAVLREVVFLKPDWATSAVYEVVDTREIQENFGRFEFEQLKKIWRDYPENKYAHLLELMKKFELCFQIPKTQTYIVPELLRPSRPEFEWDYKDNLRFEYRYEFMPAGIITRFIARTHHDIIKDDIYWRNGVVLQRENTEALVVSERLDREIRIWIRGENKRELLAIIRREIDYIHKTLNDPEVKEMIPCNCSKCKSSEGPHYYELKKLIKRLRDGQPTVQCDESYEDLNIHEILGGVVIYEKDEDGRPIIFANELYTKGGKKMEIGDVHISGGNVNFADNIERLEYHAGLGISEEELETLKAGIKGLSAEKQEVLNKRCEEFKKASKEEDRKSIGQKIKDFLVNNGIAVARALTVEAIKMIVIGTQ